MTKHQQHFTATKDGMLETVNKKIKELALSIASKRNEVVIFQNSAKNHSEFQNQSAAQNDMAQAAKLTRESMIEEHQLKNLEQEAQSIRTGNHPALQTLAMALTGKSNLITVAEYEEALAEFNGLLTDDLKAAAERIVTASEVMKYAAPDVALLIANQ